MAPFKSSFVLLALFASAMAVPMPQGGSKPFTQQNGADAIAQNNQFATLGPDSPCTLGQDACVGGKFAQCVNGKFVLTACSAGTTCAALPLVNKPGTTVTCTTEADKNARIAATGATGASGGPSHARRAADQATARQNGEDAQALNKKFAGLSTSSPCTPGENACVQNDFAQCVNGQFVVTPCAQTLQCAALPLVNSRGTSITCVDTPQALQRLADSGVGPSLTGA